LLKNGSFEEPYCGDSDRIILGIDCSAKDGFLPVNGSNTARIFTATRFVELSGDDEIIKLRSEAGIEGNVCLYRRSRQDEPASWQVSGHVLQLLDSDNSRIALLMEPLSILDDSVTASSKGDLSYDTGQESSMISQIIDVKEGCTYALSFFYWTAESILYPRGTFQMSASVSDCIENPLICKNLGYLNLKHPSWEIQWLGAGDLVIDQATGTISPSINKNFALGDLQEYQRILAAPRRSTKARVRFKQPGPGMLMLREVSFVHNNELLNKGEVEPTISKTFGFNGSDRFILECKSRQKSIFREIFQEPKDCARLELKWLPESIGFGEPKSVILGRRDFPDHIWIVAAPSGAKQVELRLTQLAGTTEVVNISLRRMETVSVPLTFLAEAPGEMTVSGMQLILFPHSICNPIFEPFQ
jgi:hypothetical protein